jgi:DNA-binding HxlR family transcriptional regulator
LSRRTYNQSCGVARSLDLLGERWTLLIIRDLLIGPRRYSDLLEGLPGIGTNMLADRLKRLGREGVVFKHPLPEPADSVVVYDLTAAGRELEPILLGLARWSWRHLDPGTGHEHTDSRWTALALRASFDPNAADDLTARYEFDLSGGKVWAHVHDGSIETGVGPSEDPDVVMRTDDQTLARIRAGRLTLDEAVERGAVQFEGTQPKISKMLEVLSRR